MIYTHVAAAVLALAVGFSSGWTVQGWRHGAAQTEALEVAAESARLRQKAATQSAERNDRETTDALRKAHAAAMDARGDLERLRLAASAVAPDPSASAAGCSDDGRLSSLARLLTEGADLVEEGGRRVEQLAAEKAALQRHVAEGP